MGERDLSVYLRYLTFSDEDLSLGRSGKPEERPAMSADSQRCHHQADAVQELPRHLPNQLRTTCPSFMWRHVPAGPTTVSGEVGFGGTDRSRWQSGPS